MKLNQIRIQGLRRLKDVTVSFGDATFLIGANNVGKTTVLKAIEHLLSAKKRLEQCDYFSVKDAETEETKVEATTVIIEAEFRDVPAEADEWRGFKGRIFEVPDGESTARAVFYRKTYDWGKDVVVEIKSKKRNLAAQFVGLTKPQEFIDAGAPAGVMAELFGALDKTITKPNESKLQDINELWNLEDIDEWFQNPGGIPGVVLARLPRFLLIPAEIADHQIHEKKGVLCETLGELFEDVRNVSPNYTQAQTFLNALAEELDPEDDESEFGKMLAELNAILSGIFPESQLHAKADLSDPNTVLKPTFQIEMSSNVRTPVQNQGTGILRSAVFGILRYRQKWVSQREDEAHRKLIIGFEEPEICLHPSAANQMRDTIYELSPESQIVATTHSPFMIDLSRRPRQVLNRFSYVEDHINVTPFSVSNAFSILQGDDKNHVKMILRIDDYVSRVFFTRNVVIIEGDTEDIVIRESLKRLPWQTRQRIASEVEFIKARGKASIIGLSKYLVSMGIVPTIIHDRDENVPGAKVMNEPIAAASGGGNVVQLEECIEDVLGYAPPSSEKPYRAFVETEEWGPDWHDIPAAWRAVLAAVLPPHIELPQPPAA